MSNNESTISSSQNPVYPVGNKTRFRRKWIGPILLLLLASLLAFILLEIFIRLFILVETVGPSFTVYDPVYGIRLKKSFSCTRITPEFRIRFSSNSMGFRGPEPDPQSDGSILFLGDSFTMGYGVNDGEEFPALIRKEIPNRSSSQNLQVINAGVGATGQGHWVKYLDREARSLNPKLVVLQICVINDFNDNMKEALFRRGPKGELLEAPSAPPKGARWLVQDAMNAIPGLPYLRSVALIRQLRSIERQAWGHQIYEGLAGEKNRNAARQNDKLTYALLEKSISLCRQNGWPILAVIVPDEPWILGDERLNQTRSLFRQFGVPFVDLPNINSRPDLYYPKDKHLNSKGHAYVADRLWKMIRETGIIEVDSLK